MDKLRGMETFVAVVECGSFTGAAARLEMSAVMVGKYIALLEGQLGTRLLERNTRRQSLTDAGRVYFDEARRVLEQVANAERSVERLRLAPAGTLRVSAPVSFGASIIAPLTASFLQAWPEVRVELDLTNRMVDLVDEGIDLAIRIGDIQRTDLVAKYLAPYRMAICAAPDYLVRHGTPQTPADLAGHQCLSHTVWTARNEWRLPGAAEEVRWKRDAVLRCNDGYALRMAAVAGAGLLLQPEVLLAEDLANGRLVRILQNYTPEPRPIHLLWRQDLRPLPKLTRFVEHLLKEVNGIYKL
ncbi:LysR family transcriptional regulator [Klebsiella aerogenes]|jgi:DNA-binding transcriptional LysR family regulator|uniref:LysR family transcriptional regulator n=1 Tax=Klebsiella aerogenes (strain ATCC 13048 / DSM 30053 / CCUG 1429 / JCM 1235 / KCTC 2190 / NBRC 13534 / NCIMB 10102 / NCTC 10006 / CDC 819-56) TaxID=1028307 RepID=A0A0H3FJU9_KLEAK|nr:LysR family transcriptional regulator [Klebsiella aerogenes]AEG95602.1 LysR family transcriptional regulator [Klebsiella aerogenes KCTC 2190]ATM93136.1 LysR family transcriptional regulator [Klebsiella aerogenes]EIV3801577.1 LysR family transcriptional regulator [Klebsiella aerogenes]EIV5431711.1 LysR family transcriptional regulator [Klebsiella aerogenes]EIV7213811.1 LysR family transcriptional regulator [Klebsiella aerogenes]